MVHGEKVVHTRFFIKMSHTFVLRTTIKYWTQVLHNQHGLVHALKLVHTHFFIKMSHTIRTAHNNKNVERVFAQPTRQKMFFVTRSKKIWVSACNCCHGGTRIYQNRICLTNHTLGENKSCNFCTFECCTICTIEFCTICTFLLDFDRSMKKCLQINGDGYLVILSYSKQVLYWTSTKTAYQNTLVKNKSFILAHLSVALFSLLSSALFALLTWFW